VTNPHDRIPLSQAARLLGFKYFRTRDLFLAGTLMGGFDDRGRVWVDRASVAQLLTAKTSLEGEAA
jgi:hypothetical protein